LDQEKRKDIDESPLLDYKAALDYVQGDKDFLKEIFEIFLEEIPQRKSNFEKALADKDMEKLTSVAHALKGVSLTIGAVSCHKLSAEIEYAARAKDFEKAAGLYKELDTVLDNLQRELHTYLN
jgi:histidine phosphotransfer protein HptB